MGRGTPRVPPDGIGFYNIVEEDDVAVPQEQVLNFEGGGVTVTPEAGKTTVTIPGATTAPVVVTAGEALAAGDLIAMDDSGGSARAFKADAAAAGGPERANPIGFADNAAAPGGPVTVVFDGRDTPSAFDVAPVAADVGTLVYMSTTPGNVTLTAPSTSGQVAQKVGVLISTTDVIVQIGDGVEIA